MMTWSKAFIAFCLLAVGGTVLVIGPSELRRMLPGAPATEVASTAKPEAKVEAKPEAMVAETTPATPPVAPAPKPAGALAETQTQVTAALADLAPIKPPPAASGAGPSFDVARIDDHGEAAVIAGQAAPGSKVELLRDGKTLDTVTADASGQFVMTPPQLPTGSYELTLRAKTPDGTVTQSTRNVPVTIAEAPPPPARLTSAQPEATLSAKPIDKPATDKQDIVASLPGPRLASAPARPRMMGAPKPRLMARAPVEPVTATAADIITGSAMEPGGNRVISRGDSLWAISRLAYGDGGRYALIVSANRDKIRNPNLIYPGQTLVVPQKAQ